MKSPLIFVLIVAILWCCHDKSNITGSTNYQREELMVLDQLIDVLIDSIGSGNKEQDTIKQVFYLRDTLSAIAYEYLKIELAPRAISVADMTRNSRYRFVRAGDAAAWKANEIFAGEWLTISRVSLDESMSAGVFHLGTWCGDLCGAGYRVEIEKVNGRWRIKSCNMIWIS